MMQGPARIGCPKTTHEGREVPSSGRILQKTFPTSICMLMRSGKSTTSYCEVVLQGKEVVLEVYFVLVSSYYMCTTGKVGTPISDGVMEMTIIIGGSSTDLKP